MTSLVSGFGEVRSEKGKQRRSPALPSPLILNEGLILSWLSVDKTKFLSPRRFPLKGKLMNLLPFAHLPLYTIFAPKRLHKHWVLPSSREKLKIKLMQIFGGKQGVSWEMCNWRMEIQNRKEARGGRWEEVDFFPFRRPLRAFFSLAPSSPPLRHKEEVAIVPWVRKTFPLRFRSLLRSSPRSIPPLARKNLWYQHRVQRSFV